MEIVILRLKVAPENRADTVNIIQSIIGPTEAHSGCILCRLYSETDDDDALLFLQKWRSCEDLEAFIRSENFRRVLAAMDLASQSPEFNVSTVSSTEGMNLIEKLRLSPQTS